MITYNGVSSDTFNANVYRVDTDDGPALDIESYQIPGRSGDLLVSNKRFPNVDVEYYAVFAGENAEKDFSDFKNFLLSQTGYKRLEDDEHPDEFYLAYVSKNIVPVLTRDRKKVKCVVTFNRKPQRFLKSGESSFSWINGQANVSGQTIQAFGPYLNSALTLTINRDFPTDATPYTTKEIPPLSSISLKLNGTKVYQSGVTSTYPVYSGSINLRTGALTYDRVVFDLSSITDILSSGSGLYEFITPTQVGQQSYYFSPIVACSDYCVEYDTSSTKPYRIWTDSGGSIHIVHTGITSLANMKAWLNSFKPKCVMVYSERTDNNAVTAYTDAFPQEWFSMSAFANVKEAPSLNVRYNTLGYSMPNPSPFESQPLIRAYGTGSFKLNDITITIGNSVTSYTDIDCEMMDCYEGSANKNSNVTFSTYDFPVLYPGDNNVTITDNTITLVEIVPRWWRL